MATNKDFVVKNGLEVGGNIAVTGTVDGRDLANDGTKLNTVETNADVTDATNVTAAGALMDSELTSIASIKALNQGVSTGDSPTFAAATISGTLGAVNTTLSGNLSAVNTTLTGYLRGPASFVIDPAVHGNNSGTVVIAGNLQVDGTQTQINSTTLTVDDINLTLASGAANAGAANGAGITIDGASASLTYASSGDKFVFNKNLEVKSDATYVTVDSADHNVALLGPRSGAGAGMDQGYLRLKSAGVNKVALDTAGHTFFNGGNVGIGITAPTTELQINSATDPKIRLESNESGTKRLDLWIDGGTAIGYIGADQSASQLAFRTVGTERIRIDADGKVGIGTSSPSSQFVVAASNGGKGIETQVTTHASNNQFILAYDRANSAYLNMELSALNFGIATNNGTNRLKILANGNVGIGTSAPAVPLHVFKGESGGVAPNSDSSLVLENSSHTYLQFLTPSNKEQGILFGDAQAANTGQITFSHQSNNMLLNAPGIIELDAGTDIKLDAAGDVIFLDGDSEKWRMQSSTGYLIGQSASQVRLVLGSTGNSSNNTSNWIRGDGTALGLNSGGGTIGFEISGSEKMHIDSAGKIKIGNNIPMWSGQFGGALFLKGNNATSDRYAQLCIVDSNGAIAQAGLKVNNNGSVTVGGAGNVIITDGDLQVASGHGIDFSATGNGSGSMSSERLDDYEEGTWTPASISGISLTVNAAVYTKIGRVVHIGMAIVFASNSNSAAVQIAGLPFPVRNQSDQAYGATIANTDVGRENIFFSFLRNSSIIGIGNSSNADVPNSVYSGKKLCLSGFYFTDA